MTAVDLDSAPFWDAVARGTFELPRCRACERLSFPPMPACASCGGTQLRWEEVSGEGSVYSCVTVHRPVAGAARWPLPYTIAVVELLGGPRVLGVASGAGLDIGAPVVVRPVAADEGAYLAVDPSGGAT